MVWLLALLCIGIVGAAGFYAGPIRAAFTFLGLMLGTMLAGTLSPLTQHLLPIVGMRHPAWGIFAPQVVSFLIVLTIFKIVGQVLHRKVSLFFKYKVDEKTLYRWQRVYTRTGGCIGVLNGAVYFLLFSMVIYSAGYFTTEFSSGDADSNGAKFLSAVRADLHDVNLDKVVAAWDMVPNKVYQAADLAATVVSNPGVEYRVSHYPPFLQLATTPDFKELAHDEQFQQLISGKPRMIEVLDYPKVHYMLTNATIVSQVSSVMANNLDDLSTFLATGQSPKYDLETILGVWVINRTETIDQIRRKTSGLTSSKMSSIEQDVVPHIDGLTLTATPEPEAQFLLKLVPTKGDATIVAGGTWKKEGNNYQVNLPGSLPETAEADIEPGNRLLLPRTFNNVNYTLIFDKEL